MSNLIIPILKALQTDPAIVKLAEGHSIPYIGGLFKVHQDYFYPFPPALLPIFVDDGNPSVTGLLKHWFLDRDTTIVKYDLETGIFSEKARNGKQFIADLLLRMNILEDGLTPDIIQFAQDMQYQDLQEIDEHAVKYGDSPKDFYHLQVFTKDPPIDYAPDLQHYKGDFPVTYRLLNQKQLEKACSFEVPKDLATTIEAPAWMYANANKQVLFDQYLNDKELDKAWLTLNSRGWVISDAINALKQLTICSTDPLFFHIAERYIDGWKTTNRLHLKY